MTAIDQILLARFFMKMYNIGRYPRMGEMKTFVIFMLILSLPLSSYAGSKKDLKKTDEVSISIRVVRPLTIPPAEDTRQPGKRLPPGKAR